MITWLIVAVCTYLAIMVGTVRALMPQHYAALRTPRNGSQMPVDDAKREAVKLALQNGALWPVFVATGALLVPLVVLFDGVPWAVRQTGKGLVAASKVAAPALAPVTNWAIAPLTAEVKRDEALALTARADEPVDDAPLVPDEIATWVPPVKPYRRVTSDDGIVTVHLHDGRGQKIAEKRWLA